MRGRYHFTFVSQSYQLGPPRRLIHCLSYFAVAPLCSDMDMTLKHFFNEFAPIETESISAKL